MSTIHFRPDYAKFLIECPGDQWHQYYASFGDASHKRQYKGEWLKSHKVNRLWFNQDNQMETWSVEIWGEWAGIVEDLPASFFHSLKRFDIRAIVWDATEGNILDVGQHLQRHITSHNVHVYSTKPATKRLGRDRGGKGFAIGSHKSDLRITVYKRTGEPVAQEFQMTGAYLQRLKEEVWTSLGATSAVRSLYQALIHAVRNAGERRLSLVLDAAGIGTYWPVIGPTQIPNLPPIQAGFIAQLPEDNEYS